ncbi:MAG: hypothetical protein HC781_23205, partial [Leptolyngbyaceae cyanobacterium CSU_1_4]|nr:hypothetical protein [Leptolyngbyaceae cyanobacterium CSU_1_4]
MIPESLAESDLSGKELLRLAYVLVDDLVLLDGNPKLHDLGKISDSIIENGFLDPPKWDVNLNGGQGGIVEGNGRAETLKWMQDQGREVPRGITVNEQGLWAVPVIFGCDSRSEIAAKRYAIDHNNLVMAGGNFTALDMSKAYDAEAYIAMLQELQEQDNLPLTTDASDLETLLNVLNGQSESYDDDESPESFKEYGENIGTDYTCPKCSYS